MKNMKLSVLGPGTNSEIAAKEYIMQLEENTIELAYCDRMSEVFGALRSGIVERIIIPVGNFVTGATEYKSIAEESGFARVAEIKIPIVHCVGISRYSQGQDFIVSHPEALKQCASYLDLKYPKINQWESASTAEAARIVSERNRGIAIAGLEVLTINGLKVIDENIIRGNWSEFWVLGNDKV